MSGSGRPALKGPSSGPLQLVDEAVSIFQIDPLRWMLLSWRPVFPLVLVSLLFVHCHRVLWLDQTWSFDTQLSSLAVSTLLLAAFLIRSAGHSLSYREVVRVAHPRALLHLDEREKKAGLLGLVSSSLLVLGPGFVMGVFGLLPGLMVVAFMVPVSGMISLEGRSLSEALLLRLEFPPGVLLRSLVSAATLLLVLLLCWVNLVVGAQLLVAALRMVSGVDVGVLATWVSPFNIDFLVYMLGLSALLMEPLWLILRALLYLDAHLSQSGMDLLERWQALPSVAGSSVAPNTKTSASLLGALLLGVIAAGSLSTTALAAEPLSLDWPEASPRVLTAQELISSLEAKAVAVDERVQVFDEFGSVELRSLRLVLLSGTLVPAQIGEGPSLRLDLEALSRELPEIVHREEQVAQLRRLSARLRESAVFLRQLQEAASRSVVPSKAEPLVADLLEQELSQGGYELAAPAKEGLRYRQGVRERLQRWWKEWFESEEPSGQLKAEPLNLPKISPLVYALMALAFGLPLLMALFRVRKASPVPGQPDVMEANSRSPLEALMSPSQLRREALLLAERQLYGEATRALFLATLVSLDSSREIDLCPEFSNGEYLRAFAGSKDRRQLFAQAISRFEAHCYGPSLCSSEDFEQMLDIASELLLDTASARAFTPERQGGLR